MNDFEVVTTDKEFNDALNGLIQSAYANGVNAEGGWECRTRSGNPDWDVVILEVGKEGSRDANAEEGRS